MFTSIFYYTIQFDKPLDFSFGNKHFGQQNKNIPTL